MIRDSLFSPATIGIVACLATGPFFATPAVAQDPAAVGGYADPALVGAYDNSGAAGRGAVYGGSRTSLSTVREAAEAAAERESSAGQIETLLKQVENQLAGTLNTDTNNGDYNSAVRYRSDAETLIRRNWSQLGPLTRDLYTANYDRTNPNDSSQRYHSPYGDGGQIEAELLGGAADAQGAMQNLRDLLLPMLKDLKQGLDNELQQRAHR